VLVVTATYEMGSGWVHLAPTISAKVESSGQILHEVDARDAIELRWATVVEVYVHHESTKSRTLEGALIGSIYRASNWVPALVLLTGSIDRGNEGVDDGVPEVSVLYLLTKDESFYQFRELFTVIVCFPPTAEYLSSINPLDIQADGSGFVVRQGNTVFLSLSPLLLSSRGKVG
jgi:hypothetical protein